MTTATGILTQKRLRLLELEFDVDHRPERQHQAPDAVSQIPTTGADTTPLHKDLPVFSITGEDEAEAEETPINTSNLCILCDDDTTSLKKSAQKNPGHDEIRPEAFQAEQATDKECNRFSATISLPGSSFETDSRGFLCRVSKIYDARQLAIPSSLHKLVLYESHDPLLQGHPGTARMYNTMRLNFTGPSCMAKFRITLPTAGAVMQRGSILPSTSPF